MTTDYFNGMGDTMLAIFGNATKAILRPKQGRPQTGEVIFNSRYQEVDRDGKPYGGERPFAAVRDNVFNPEPKENDEIEIEGTLYIIRDLKFDGLELTELLITEKVDQQCT